VYWPALLMGHGGLNLPTNVPANQYITFKGAKASKSMGVGRSIGWYAERLQPDALRYAIASVLPEQNDTDLSDDQMIERINSELVATWGNLVNRVLSMAAKHFDGAVPPRGTRPRRPGPDRRGRHRTRGGGSLIENAWNCARDCVAPCPPPRPSTPT
jgi:methionyl-tRNA synthetase